MAERFRVVFEVMPPGPFGLPAEGRIVLPGPQTKVDYQIHPVTNAPLGPATVSRYRAEADALNVRVKIENALVVFEDNVVTVELEGEQPQAALEAASNLLRRLLRHLGELQGPPSSRCPACG